MSCPSDTPSRLERRKVLVVRGHGHVCDDLLADMGHCFDVTTVDGVEPARNLLGKGGFDAVFSDTADFLLLEQAAVSQQAISILNTIGEGVCILDSDGTFVWSNNKMQEFTEAVHQSVACHSSSAYAYFTKRLAAGEKNLRPCKYSCTDTSSDRYFEMIATAMLDLRGNFAHVAMVVWEATASRRLQQRIDVIDKAGRELVRLEAESFSRLSVEQRITLLEDKIIRYAKDLLNFDHFVVRILNRQTNRLEILFGVNLPLDEQNDIFSNSQNNGITGYVAATGRSYICNNPQEDSRYLPGMDGSRCSLTVPLRLHDKVVGTINVESHKESAFHEDDRQMAEIFGRYIAIAMNILDLLVVERNQTTGQAAEIITRHIAEPLSEIITEASLLMEEYIGHDDIRHRLHSVIEHTDKIKVALNDAQAPTGGVLGVRSGRSVSLMPELQDKRILIVDDEHFIRQTIADVVRKFGCITDTAHDGREAKSLLIHQHYDLVISDIKLPHADGYEVFAAARASGRNTAVILMTGFGYDPHHCIVRANREGLSAVLYKPFKVEQLMEEIRRAVTKDPGADGVRSPA